MANFWKKFFGMSIATRTLAVAWSFCVIAFILNWQVAGIFDGFLNIITPALATLTIYVITRESAATRRGRIEQALGGKIHETSLNQILANQSEFDFVASEQVVTLMFIDIVGFSKASETQSPKEAFSSLKELLGSLTKTVQDHGGIVDKSLGDGLLCYFGYYCAGMDCNTGTCSQRTEEGQCAQHCSKSKWIHNHAERAVRCAIEIQKSNGIRMNHADQSSRAVYPLRIGINTAAVYIGDVGTNHRVDFTVIGQGVNFAQRLEAACDSNMIMIGPATHDLLSVYARTEWKCMQKMVQIKHHEELTEAYEIDPFEDRPDILQRSIAAYRKFSGANRHDTRWLAPEGHDLKILTDFGMGELQNFSYAGFQIKFSQYIAKGAKINMTIESDDPHIQETFAGMGLVPILIEIRWAKALDSGGCVHGCMIQNLTEHRQKFLHSTLRNYFAKRGELKRAA